jgi:sortase A
MGPDGVMQDPSGTEAVAWYPFEPLPNEGGNIFLAGHLLVGGHPAVFWDLNKLEAGHQVIIRAGGVDFYYSVVSEEYQTKADALHAVTDTVDGEVVTLMTCAGSYIPSTGDYTHRWIVRAVRVN